MTDWKNRRRSKNVIDLRPYRTAIRYWDSFTYIPPDGRDEEDQHKMRSILALQGVKGFSDEYAEQVLRNYYKRKYPSDFHKLMEPNMFSNTPVDKDYLYEKFKKHK